MNEESISISLKDKFNKLSMSIHQAQKKYFHLHTVKNFIYHFEEISNRNDQIWISKKINDYLDMCEKYVDVIDRDISKEIYMKYLDKVGDYYRENLNFSLYTSPDIILLLFFALLFLIRFFLSWRNSIVLIVFSSLIYLFYLFYKRKINKTFGFFH